MSVAGSIYIYILYIVDAVSLRKAWSHEAGQTIHCDRKLLALTFRGRCQGSVAEAVLEVPNLPKVYASMMATWQ